MAKEYDRMDRVADHLRRELAALIQTEIRDPRVGMVNITDVEVSRDLGHSRVFFTLVGKDVVGKDVVGKDVVGKDMVGREMAGEDTVGKDMVGDRVGKDSPLEEEAEEVTAALNRAAGFMRSRLSRDSGMRTVPRLRFQFDASIGRGRYMDALIDRAVTPRPRGEASPVRKPGNVD